MVAALLDSNVLVHAAYKKSARHASAAWLVDSGLRQKGRFCIAPQNLVEFAAVVTRLRFVDPPLSGAEVARMTDILYRSRRLAKIYPQRGTVARAMREGSALGIQGPRWYDLFLAVTMRDAGVPMVVTDNVSDFSAIPFIDALPIDDAVKQFSR
jgi:predicted nucleic acid-binding protein